MSFISTMVHLCFACSSCLISFRTFHISLVPIPSSEQRFSSRCYTPDQDKRSCRIVVFERLVGSATSRLDSEAAHSLTVVFTAIEDQEPR